MSTKPQKSNKYRRYYASKYKYPTETKKGGMIGHKSAQRSIESQLKRPLRLVKIESRGSQWVFVEHKV